MAWKRSVLVLAVLCLVATGAQASISPVVAGAPGAEAQPNALYRWTVNLDLPPEQRWDWNAMAAVYGPTLHAATDLIAQFIPKEDVPYIVGLAAEIANLGYLGDYAGELRSLSKVIGVPMGELVLLNLIYEVEAGCTSIIAEGPDGSLYHGRNLDFNLAGVLRNLTTEVLFQSQGRLVFTATTYAGYVGVLTGMRPGAFSISLDQRESGYRYENLLMDAVAALSNTPIAAPAYIIVGGKSSGEGAVITRDREWARDVWYLSVDDGRWFEVETNFDHWKPPGDERRSVANRGMLRLGWLNVSLNGILNVLSTHPVLNGGTTYTTLMSATTGNYTTIVR